MPTYKERVQAIAEEMAAKSRPKQWEQCFRERDEITAQYMEAARIAVKYMANAAGNAYLAVEDGHCMGAGTYVKEQGLIPDQEDKSSQFTKFMRGYGGLPDQEAGEDEKK